MRNSRLTFLFLFFIGTNVFAQEHLEPIWIGDVFDIYWPPLFKPISEKPEIVFYISPSSHESKRVVIER